MTKLAFHYKITRGNYWPSEWRSAAKYEVEPRSWFHINSLPPPLQKKHTITTYMRISCNAKLQVSATLSVKAPPNDQTFNMQFLCSKTFIMNEAHRARTVIPNLYSAGVTQRAPRFHRKSCCSSQGWLHHRCRCEASYFETSECSDEKNTNSLTAITEFTSVCWGAFAKLPRASISFVM